MNKIEFINDYTKNEFLRMLNRCEKAIKEKNKKIESDSITKEECEDIYYMLIHKESGLLKMIKGRYFDGTFGPARPKPHYFHYQDLMRIMNFYHVDSLSVEDIELLRQQMQSGECKIYNKYYINQYYPEGEKLYYGRFLEYYNDEDENLS